MSDGPSGSSQAQGTGCRDWTLLSRMFALPVPLVSLRVRRVRCTGRGKKSLEGGGRRSRGGRRRRALAGRASVRC